jgi:hypothetical protein
LTGTATKRALSRSGACQLINAAQWTLFLITASLTAAYIAWLVLAQVNFLYPIWHDLIGIDRTIEVYGPQNGYRAGFEQTTKAERSRLFAAIVDATHNQGAGLQRLVYHDAAGRQIGKLLREPEIVHLQDVARLIDALLPVGFGATIVTVALLLAVRWQRMAVPSFWSMLAGMVASGAAIAITVLLLGPVDVFYRLHRLVFPPGHAWFFYYQDSLMSTMMKAPDLFGYIALAWGLLSLFLLTGLLSVVRTLSPSN